MESIYEKIKKIEALIQGTNVEGERLAAIAAKKRLMETMPVELPQYQHAKEFSLGLNNLWNKKLMLALCGKYELKPYRYRRQKHTTVMVRCNPDFMDRVLWPEYIRYADMLEVLVTDITTDLISKIHHGVEEEAAPGQLEDGR